MYSFSDVTYKKISFLYLPFGGVASIHHFILHTGNTELVFRACLLKGQFKNSDC